VSEEVVQSLWDEHVGWSRTAARLKSRRALWRSVVLILTVLGAALQTLAATVEISLVKMAAGALGTVALALVPFLARSFLTAEDTRKWLRARSVSEGIKSEIFTYRAAAEPYVGPDALERLRKKTRDIRDWGKSLELERARDGSPTQPAPPSLDADAYLQRRAYQQVNEYYRPKAKQNAELAERFRWAELFLAGLAAVFSAAATFTGEPGALGPWVAVLTTIGGSVATHAAASRYDFQATMYFATARQLVDLAQDWKATGKSVPSREWSEFVRGCEEAISTENRSWMAKLDEPSQ
jgi:conflict system pore-forming effector with SLATT domain/uncharacterized protein DUF4231